MKTTNIKSIISAIVISLITLLVTTKISANSLPMVALMVSYFAIAGLFILAATDSRGGPKNYSLR